MFLSLVESKCFMSLKTSYGLNMIVSKNHLNRKFKRSKMVAYFIGTSGREIFAVILSKEFCGFEIFGQNVP